MRYLMVVLVLVAGCGRTITEPTPCNVEPIHAPVVGVAGDTATLATVYFCGVR
jgi:hypothetical protein